MKLLEEHIELNLYDHGFLQKTMKLLGEKIELNLYDHGFYNGFLDITSKSWATKEKK